MLIVTPIFISWYTNVLQLKVLKYSIPTENYPISCQIWTYLLQGQDGIWLQWKTTEYWDIPYTLLLFLIKYITKQPPEVKQIHLTLPEGEMLYGLTGIQPRAQGWTQQPLLASEPAWKSGCSSTKRPWVWENVLTPALLSSSGTLRGEASSYYLKTP